METRTLTELKYICIYHSRQRNIWLHRIQRGQIRIRHPAMDEEAQTRVMALNGEQ
jgi:hypothetical protein